jgi:hypothetical protein
VESSPPGCVRALTVEPKPAGVMLRWEPPAGDPAAEPTKYYVVRLRVGKEARVETTRFVGPSRHTLDEDGLAPGRYRFLVGALSAEGSSPSVSVDVSVG